MFVISVVLSFTAGLFSSVQGLANSIGSEKVGIPWLIAGMSAVQFMVPLGWIYLQRKQTGGIQIDHALSFGWKWFVLAGLLGVVIVAAMSFAIPHVGTLLSFVLVILGQIIGAAIADQIGLFGVSVRPLTFNRVGSIVMIAAGVVWLLADR